MILSAVGVGKLIILLLTIFSLRAITPLDLSRNLFFDHIFVAG